MRSEDDVPPWNASLECLPGMPPIPPTLELRRDRRFDLHDGLENMGTCLLVCLTEALSGGVCSGTSRRRLAWAVNWHSYSPQYVIHDLNCNFAAKLARTFHAVHMSRPPSTFPRHMIMPPL
jgi:hypothetical protein